MAEKQVIVRLTARIDAYKRSMAEAKRSTSSFASESQRATMRLGSQMQSVGKQMTTAVSLPLVAVGGLATKMAVDFDQSMTRIQTLVGLSADEVEGMKASVLGLAGDTARSPQELADALFVVTSAGLRGEEAMSALEMAAKASAIGMGETKDIARAVAGAVNAYGSDVLSAADATDILTATARAGNFETSELAGALGRVLPFAQQAQVGLDDVGGSIALLTRNGLSASESITQITGLMKAFVVPTRESITAMDALGISADEIRQSLGEQGLVATLQMLQERTGGSTEELRRIIGTAEGTAAAISILEADAATLTDTFGTVSEASGIVGEGFGQLADSDAFKFQKAINDVKVALTELGTVILPIVTSVASGVATMVSSFSDLDPAVRNVVLAFGGLAAAIGPALMVVGSLIRNFQLLKMTVSGLSLASLGPWAGLALAIGAVTSALVLSASQARTTRDEYDDLRDSINEMGGAIQDSLKGASDPFDVLGGLIRGAAEENDDLRRIIDATGLSFRDLAANIATEEYSAFTDTTDTTTAALLRATQAAEFDADARVNLSGVVNELTNEIREQYGVFLELDEIQQRGVGTADESAAALVGVDAGLEDVGDSAADAAADLEAFNSMVEANAEALIASAEALLEQASGMRSAADANLGLLEAQDQWAVTLAENTEALGEVEKGTADWRAIQIDTTRTAAELADAAVAQAEALAEAEGATLSEAEAQEIWNGKMIASAAQAKGPLRESILSYIAAANGIPPEKVTDILALLDEGKIEDAEEVINHTSRARESQITAEAYTARAEGALNSVARNRVAQIFPVIGGASYGVGGIPQGHSGGIVPGPVGAEVPVLAKAGEMIVPTPITPNFYDLMAQKGGSSAGDTYNVTLHNHGDPVGVSTVTRGIRMTRLLRGVR